MTARKSLRHLNGRGVFCFQIVGAIALVARDTFGFYFHGTVGQVLQRVTCGAL
jgi:hypothetical protein